MSQYESLCARTRPTELRRAAADHHGGILALGLAVDRDFASSVVIPDAHMVSPTAEPAAERLAGYYRSEWQRAHHLVPLLPARMVLAESEARRVDCDARVREAHAQRDRVNEHDACIVGEQLGRTGADPIAGDPLDGKGDRTTPTR